jgi:hypothetical protein
MNARLSCNLFDKAVAGYCIAFHKIIILGHDKELP